MLTGQFLAIERETSTSKNLSTWIIAFNFIYEGPSSPPIAQIRFSNQTSLAPCLAVGIFALLVHWLVDQIKAKYLIYILIR